MTPRFLSAPIFSVILVTGFLFSSAPTSGSLLQDVLSYTNNFRKSRGLAPLVMRDDLNRIAQQHSEDMAKGRTGFGHGGFGKRELLARQKIKDANSFAENVAYGATSGKEVVDEWKSSPGHRRNLLGSYRYIGIGIATDRNHRIYYTQIFVD
jgi:uncharacterized protein YkwD